jgi:hypothetical protein
MLGNGINTLCQGQRERWDLMKQMTVNNNVSNHSKYSRY